MNNKNQNAVFQLIQALQLGLLTAQGLLLVIGESKSFYAPIWVGLAVCSLIQLLIVFKYPKKIETTQIIDRSAVLRLRLVALVPYILILIGLLVVV